MGAGGRQCFVLGSELQVAYHKCPIVLRFASVRGKNGKDNETSSLRISRRHARHVQPQHSVHAQRLLPGTDNSPSVQHGTMYTTNALSHSRMNTDQGIHVNAIDTVRAPYLGQHPCQTPGYDDASSLVNRLRYSTMQVRGGAQRKSDGRHKLV